MALSIREMRASDLPSVASLCDQLGYPTSPETLTGRFASLNGRRGEQMLVAIQHDRVLGWVHVRRVDSLESDPHGERWGLVVDDEARSQGVGRALVETAERWATEHGLPSIRVRSNVVRERAHAFSERAGYTVVKRQSVFEKRLT
ncbi:MAG: GNAT family N-acetyltransferase [Acidobacteriota bacterium]